MKTLGNLIWLIFGGFILGLAWFMVGIMWCITIIGIPVGVQCFKFAQLSFWPFGSEVIYGGGAGSLLVNILWLIFGGSRTRLTCGRDRHHVQRDHRRYSVRTAMFQTRATRFDACRRKSATDGCRIVSIKNIMQAVFRYPIFGRS